MYYWYYNNTEIIFTTLLLHIKIVIKKIIVIIKITLTDDVQEIDDNDKIYNSNYKFVLIAIVLISINVIKTLITIIKTLILNHNKNNSNNIYGMIRAIVITIAIARLMMKKIFRT